MNIREAWENRCARARIEKNRREALRALYAEEKKTRETDAERKASLEAQAQAQIEEKWAEIKAEERKRAAEENKELREKNKREKNDPVMACFQAFVAQKLREQQKLREMKRLHAEKERAKKRMLHEKQKLLRVIEGNFHNLSRAESGGETIKFDAAELIPAELGGKRVFLPADIVFDDLRREKLPVLFPVREVGGFIYGYTRMVDAKIVTY